MVALASSVPIVLYFGSKNRNEGEGRGIGWSFIRFIVIALALPIIAMLGISGTLDGNASTLLAGAMGYAFGKSE